MTNPDDPYFPSPYTLGEKCPHYVQGGRAVCQSCSGISIRVKLAALEMQGLLSNTAATVPGDTHVISIAALKAADSLIEEANREH